MSLFVAFVFEISPREARERDGKRYEIRRGFGFPGVLVPGFVLFAAGDQHCRLVIIDMKSGAKEVIGHDIPLDIYEAHPEVWPDKVPKRT